MRKVVLTSFAAAFLATLGVSHFALAAAGDPPPPPAMGSHMDHGFMLDAKLAGMKAALKLTADQEKLWTPFEAAVRDIAKANEEQWRKMREMRDAEKPGERPSPIEHMLMMSDHLTQGAAELKQVADAAKPLYDSLDDGQKHHFGPLLMTLRDPHHGGEHRHWGGPEGAPPPR